MDERATLWKPLKIPFIYFIFILFYKLLIEVVELCLVLNSFFLRVNFVNPKWPCFDLCRVFQWIFAFPTVCDLFGTTLGGKRNTIFIFNNNNIFFSFKYIVSSEFFFFSCYSYTCMYFFLNKFLLTIEY